MLAKAKKVPKVVRKVPSPPRVDPNQGSDGFRRFGGALRKRPFACDANQANAPTKTADTNMLVVIPNLMVQHAVPTMQRSTMIKHPTDSRKQQL